MNHRAAPIPSVALPSAASMPVLGLGTWRMAQGRHSAQEEIAALRLGLDLGMTMIDTAEMYADGAAEELVGRAMAGRRDEVFLVSKVLPGNATRRGTVAACQRSLRRLRTDRLDLYLLHWRGRVALSETVAGFGELRRAGLIRHWGVSNFDVADLSELQHAPGGADVEADQVLYNLARRGIEGDLLAWCGQRGVAIMAYSPIGQGALAGHRALNAVGARHGATAAQVALAWVLSREGVVAIPGAGTREHVRENRSALDLRLDAADLAELDRAFPPPPGPQPLGVV